MFDELWPGGPKFRQVEGSFKLSTDSVMLADFVSSTRARKIIDLGCGAGVLTVLLNVSHPLSEISGVEIQENSAQLCRSNLKENGFPDKRILCADLRQHRSLLTAGDYDLVVSNPPYFASESGYAAPDEARATARDERSCTLKDLCTAAAYLCRWGGYFAVVHRPERLSELFCTMTANGLEPKRLRMIQHRPDSIPNLVLVEGRRGGKPGLTVERPLILCNPDGSDSEEARRIYHRG